MTFTEAAVEVLRLVGRPLHYKKITEIAIARNLLSHVGKSPDMTMSSRLATMVKKDRGEEPIIKVKPGVFGLREFGSDVLALADADFEVDLDALPPPAPRDAAPEDADVQEAPRRPLPGAEVFPAEDDDDEPILAAVRSSGGGDAGGDSSNDDGRGRGKRRRRRRKGRDDEESTDTPSASDRNESRGRGRSRRGSSSSRGAESSGRRRAESLDMNRAPDEGDRLGRDLADAVFSVLDGWPREPVSHVRLAEELIRLGRLGGSPTAVAPTLAAAVRADGQRRGAAGPRFRTVEGELALMRWYLPREAARFEEEALAASQRQREVVHRSFLRKLAELPAAGFAELMASWLNSEGVTGLRAVRRPGSSATELHLAGVMRRGLEEIPLGIVILRDGGDLDASKVVEVRGALNHYGPASAAWVVTIGRVRSAARDEGRATGVAPVTLFDGPSLAEALELRGVGLRALSAPLATIDHDLLDALRGGPEELGRGRERRDDRDRDRGRRDEAQPEDDSKDEKKAAEGSDPKEEEGAAAEGRGDDDKSASAEGEQSEDGSGRGRRRRRRRGRGRSKERAEGGPEDAAEASDEPSDGEAKPGSRRKRRRGAAAESSDETSDDSEADAEDPDDAGSQGADGDDGESDDDSELGTADAYDEDSEDDDSDDEDSDDEDSDDDDSDDEDSDDDDSDDEDSDDDDSDDEDSDDDSDDEDSDDEDSDDDSDDEDSEDDDSEDDDSEDDDSEDEDEDDDDDER